MAPSATHPLRAALLALLVAPVTSSSLPAQQDEWFQDEVFRKTLLELVAAADHGFSSYATSEGKVLEADTSWSVPHEGCRLWGRAREGSRDFRCKLVEGISHAGADTVYGAIAPHVRQALGTTWTFDESVGDDSPPTMRRSLDARRRDGVQVSLSIWEWEQDSDVQLQVSTPAAAVPRQVAQEGVAPDSTPRAPTVFQTSLLEMITEAEDGFEFVVDPDLEGEVVNGDTVYQALAVLESEGCNVWGYRNGSREYACAMMNSENEQEVEARFDALAAEVRGVLGATWTFREANGGRGLTAMRDDGLEVRLWRFDDAGIVTLVLAVVAP
jgi:hypothetical protein